MQKTDRPQMVIDAGQAWKHKHNGRLVSVLGASDGLVVFMKDDRKQEWNVARFLVWYRYVCNVAAPDQPPKPGSSQARLADSFSEEQRQLQANTPIHDENPKVGELWFSLNREESCVIEEIENGDSIVFRYATDRGQRRMQAWWFRQSHVHASTVARPKCDLKSVAFPAALSAEEMINGARKQVKRCREARATARAVMHATRPIDIAAYQSVKDALIQALNDCHDEAQALRVVLDELEAT